MTDADRRLDAFLDDLRSRLRGLTDSEVADIVAELRGHVHDSAASDGPATEIGIVSALLRLGSPEEIASLYQTENLLGRARHSSAPTLLIRGLFRWATVSVAGCFALVGLIAGYVLAASLFLAAVVKPIAPHRAGLWRLPGDEVSLRIGLRAAPPPGSQEVLGWWIVPLGLLAGAIVLWLTPRFGRWAISRFRRTLPMPMRRPRFEDDAETE